MPDRSAASPFRRPWLRWLVVVAAVLGGLYWLAGSEAFLRFAAGQAVALAGGKLRIGGLHGSIFGPLRVDELDFSTSEKRIEVRDAGLDWSPGALLHGVLTVGQLAVAEVRVVELQPSGQPPELPASLALPVDVEIPHATLRQLVIRGAGGEQAFTAIDLSLAKPADRYRLTVHNVTTPWGRLQAQASLAQSRPYDLAGSGDFRGGRVSARFDAKGTLARIGLHATSAVAGGQADADLVLTPFAPIVLAEARVTGRGLDPNAFDKQWPTAAIDLRANLAGQPGAMLAGAVGLSNAQPGTLDQRRLPIKAMTAHVAADTQRVRLDNLHLDLDRAGQFTGQGTIAAAGLTLALHTGNLDPRGIYSRMRTLPLAGDIRLQANADRQAVIADLGYRRYRLSLDGALQNRVVQLNKLLLSSAPGSLELQGTVHLDASRRFQLAGTLLRFDPAAFGDYPSAEVNATFTGEGQMAPTPEGRLKFAIRDSSLRHRPLSGHGDMHLAEHRLWDSDVSLDLAGNRLELHGAYGGSGDRLGFTVSADRLSAIDPALSGRLEAQGTLSGTPSQPSGRLKLRAEALASGRDYRLRSLEADGRLEPAANGTAQLNLVLIGLKTPALDLDQAEARIQGRRDLHQISLTARSPRLDLTAELDGGWHAGPGAAGYWSGRIVKLRNGGRYPVALQAPADLEAGRDRFRLADARLALLGGAFDLAELRYQAGRFDSHGRYQDLPLSTLARFGALPEEVGGDLTLAGDWNVDVGDQVNGRLTARRQAGDLVLASDPPTALGLTGLGLVVEAKRDQVTATLNAAGAALGRLGAAATSRLTKRDGRWGVAGTAPIQANADLALQSLAWASPLVDRTGAIQLAGSLQGRLQAGGTVAAPRLDGTLAGAGIGLTWPDQGLSFKDGEFQAELRQDTLELTRLVLHSGDGQLTGHGSLALADARPRMQLALNADKLRVVSRPDRLLILSGAGQIAMAETSLRVDAKLKADRGQFELPRANAPQVSSDVVVLGRPTPAPSRVRLPAIDLNLALDLGEHFSLKGRGLDAQLGGTVRVAKQGNGPLKGNGTIRVVKGTYYAYGQQLSIDRGLVNFQGPIDNPGLNIVAMRKNQDVEAGVAITGTAQAPQIALVSNPTVPDSEKLSWLVLGHGLADTNSSELDSLQIAAGALLGAGQSVPLQQRIANAVGLSELSLKGTGTLESTVLSLGKRLSSKAYVTFEQGVAGGESLMKINYSLSKRLSVSAQAGAAPAADLFYTFSFD